MTVCEHNRYQPDCTLCGGKNICEHNRRRRECVHCKSEGVKAFCEHGKRRRFCVTCNGSSVCPHGRHRSYCMDCPISDFGYAKLCKICKITRVESHKGVYTCRGCRVLDMERIENKFGDMIIGHVGHPPNSKDKSIVKTDICGDLDRRRPDLLWVVPGKLAVVVEIDEDSHVGRETSCEVRKISEQNLAIGGMEEVQYCPVVTIRVNPDKCDVSDASLEDRAMYVGELVKKLIHNDFDVEQNGGSKIIFCYYHTKSQKHINEHKKHWNCEVFPADRLTELAEMAEVVEAAEDLNSLETLS